MSNTLTIGFIGLGAMGSPMASRLVDAGFSLVTPRHSARTDQAAKDLGAEIVGSVSATASRSDVLITMLPDTPDVIEVATGPASILEGATAGLIWIDMSTISPIGARDLAAEARVSGIRPLDAPVSGGTRGAEDGTLTTMVGGDSEDLENVRGILETLSSRIVHVGGSGAGQVAKAANQMIVGGTIALVAEALTLAQKMGCDPAIVREALRGGFADSRILEVHGDRMVNRTFPPGFRSRLQRKDLGIALDGARTCDMGIPMTAVVHELFNTLCALGGGDLDHSGLIIAIETLAGLGQEGFSESSPN